MTIHCNMERWWGTITSTPNEIVVFVELLPNLPILQKPRLQSMNIHMTLWPKPMSQSVGYLDEGFLKQNEHVINNAVIG